MMIDAILILAALLLLIIKFTAQRPKNFPPGLPNVPIFGSLPFMSPNLFQVIRKLTKKHGKIFSFYLGQYSTIVIADFELYKQAMSDDTFINRASVGAIDDCFHPDRFGNRQGIMFSNGSTWVEQRRFCHRQMKDLGFGRKRMEPLILEEAMKMRKVLQTMAGSAPTSLQLQLNVSILNAMWHILTGEKLEYNDTRCQEIVQKFCWMMKTNSINMTFVFPWLKHLMPKSSGYRNIVEANKMCSDLIEESLETHMETFDGDNLRDFTDVYIHEMIKYNDDPQSSFNADNGRENFSVVMVNLFLAGSETTSNTLNFTLWYLCQHPHAQARLQAEVDRVIGPDRCPSMDDRADLPYMEAVCHETQRIVGLAFNGIPRESIRDIKLDGYDIPKGTRMQAAIFEIMHDPTYWQDPEEYRPERFLSQDGKFLPDPRFVAFGIGKRNCMGKALAQMELLLFLAVFVQHFRFSFPADYDPTTFKSEVGLILTCPDYPILIEERNH